MENHNSVEYYLSCLTWFLFSRQPGMVHKSSAPVVSTQGQLYLPQLQDSLIGQGIPRSFHDSLVSSRRSLALSVTISKPRNKFDFNVRSASLPMHPNSLGCPHEGARGARSTTAQYTSAIHLDNSAFIAVTSTAGYVLLISGRRESISRSLRLTKGLGTSKSLPNLQCNENGEQRRKPRQVQTRLDGRASH
jgi:hypothetical protein